MPRKLYNRRKAWQQVLFWLVYSLSIFTSYPEFILCMNIIDYFLPGFALAILFQQATGLSEQMQCLL